MIHIKLCYKLHCFIANELPLPLSASLPFSLRDLPCSLGYMEFTLQFGLVSGSFSSFSLPSAGLQIKPRTALGACSSFSSYTSFCCSEFTSLHSTLNSRVTILNRRYDCTLELTKSLGSEMFNMSR